MNGRLEHELKVERKIDERLKELPFVFTEFYYYLKSSKSINTIIRYIGYVEDFMNYVTQGRRDNEFYKTVKVSTIRQYLSSLEKRVVDGQIVRMGPEMQATRWSAINTFFKFLIMDGYIVENPMLKTSRPKTNVNHKITYLEPDEIEIVLKAIEDTANPRLKYRELCIVSLALSTGLRISAISQANIEDINFETNTIHVIEKEELYRDIQFGTQMRGLLLSWIKDRALYFNGEEYGPLFISQHRNRLSNDAIRDVVNKYTSSLGKHIKVHDLRKTTATNLARQGFDIRTIQDFVGHKNVNTTMRYIAVLDQEKKRATEAMDGMIKCK
jgi:site-specific recombinase XerD